MVVVLVWIQIQQCVRASGHVLCHRLSWDYQELWDHRQLYSDTCPQKVSKMPLCKLIFLSLPLNVDNFFFKLKGFILFISCTSACVHLKSHNDVIHNTTPSRYVLYYNTCWLEHQVFLYVTVQKLIRVF